MFKPYLSSIIAFILALSVVTACGGNKADNSGAKTEVANGVPTEIQLKDKFLNYANFTHNDPGKVETAYRAKFGDKAVTAFNADFLQFLVETDPAINGMDVSLPAFYTMTLMSGTFGPMAIAPARRTIDNTDTVEEVGGDGDSTRNEANAAAQLEQAKKILTSLNSFFGFVQGRIIDDAGFFELKLKAAAPNDFPLPEGFFGVGSSSDRLKPELKEILQKFLYSVTFNVEGQFYSFFQFFPDASEVTARKVFGKFPVFFPAKDNVMFKEMEVTPHRAKVLVE